MEKDLPKRKKNRLDGYDYGSSGAYFITICSKDRKNILSTVVGDGAHDVPKIVLTTIGEVIEKYILSTNRIEDVYVDKYIIMPNHIHMIVFIKPQDDSGTSRAPSPTNEIVPHVVSTLKRLCNKEIGHNIFQRSYFDHIIRDKEDYNTRVKYIHENPMRWYYKNLTIE
ncbi:MAG: transposase [Clostridia bacterium]|nr:transposase [Clostridia bacterium]